MKTHLEIKATAEVMCPLNTNPRINKMSHTDVITKKHLNRKKKREQTFLIAFLFIACVKQFQ